MNSPSNENYPKTYEAYLQLCDRRGVEQRLDKQTFESVLETNSKPTTAESLETLMGKSQDELLVGLGASLHLEELVNPGKPAI